MPRFHLAAWAGLALVAGALLILLVQFWGTRPEYADRFLILLAATSVARNCRRTMPPARPSTWWVVALALLTCGLFPIAGYLQTQATGGRSALLWLHAGTLAIAAASLMLAGGGWPRLRHFAFPLLVPFFALPLPSRILDPLQTRLQEITTTIAAFILPMLNLPVERTGFVLKLAAGDLGVAEACSGVQSLTALTALAAFVAYWKGFGPGRGALLTLMAVPIVVAVNAIRVILSGLIQEYAGREYIRGDWHDVLGFTLIFVGLVCIVGVAAALHRVVSIPLTPAKVEESIPPIRGVQTTVALLVLVGISLGGVAYYQGSARDNATAELAPLEQIPLQFAGWHGTDQPVPDSISATLGQDRILHRVYENNLGQTVSVWVIYWSSAKLVKGYHHPDVCLGNLGFHVTAKRVETLRPKNSGAIPATAREFHRGERDSQFVLYWTQEGNRIWDDADEVAAQNGSGFDWFASAFSGRRNQPTGRLVVLVGTDGTSPLAQSETARFCTELAGELYTLCPWATPPGPLTTSAPVE
jgi:EpsI family protein